MAKILNRDVDPAKPALIGSSGGILTYGELRHPTGALVSAPRSLVFIEGTNELSYVANIVSAIEAGHAVGLLNPGLTPSRSRELVDLYRPRFFLGRAPLAPSHWRHVGQQFGVDVFEAEDHDVALAPELCLLLSTSGSTGSPKFVRLSRTGVEANIHQIVHALDLNASDKPIAHLPVHYSFGLSVVTSHLSVGATIVLTTEPVTSNKLWAAVREHACNSISGVPTHFELMRKLGFDRLNVPSLKSFCQAGGRASPELLTVLLAETQRRAGKLYVMYGQTEAGPRMSTLQSKFAGTKLGSVGQALIGSKFEIKPLEGEVSSSGNLGEVIFHGPNVMMGYAQHADDLQLGDECGGSLATGDLGYLDNDGCLWLTGRLSRLAKVHGQRVSLDDVERLANPHGDCAAVELDDKIGLLTEVQSSQNADMVAHSNLVLSELNRQITLPSGCLLIRCVHELPRLPSGKIDYRRCAELLRSKAA